MSPPPSPTETVFVLRTNSNQETGSTAQLFALIWLALLVGCRGPDAPQTKSKDRPLETITVELLKVQSSTWPRIVRSQGSLFSDEQSLIGTKIAGRISEVHVDLGDNVKQGDPIVTLDQEELRLLVQQAEAQLEQARSAVGLEKSAALNSLNPENSPPVRQERALWDEAKQNLKRATSLKSENAISPSEFDQVAAAERVAEARYSAALNSTREKIALINVRSAELALAQQQLAEAVIRSPLDGFIARRDVAPGTFLSAGQTLAMVVRTNPLRFRGTVPERFTQDLAIGQTITLKIESIQEPKTTTITRISPTLDQQSRSLAFEADVQNDATTPMRTGLFAEAELVIDPQAQAIAIPTSAIIEFAGAQKVWKVVDGIATEQEILCGMKRGEQREVIDGLQAGDLILADAGAGRVAMVIDSKSAVASPPQSSGIEP